MVLIFHMSRTKSQKFNLPKDMLLTKSWLWIKPRSNSKVIFLEGKGEISGSMEMLTQTTQESLPPRTAEGITSCPPCHSGQDLFMRDHCWRHPEGASLVQSAETLEMRSWGQAWLSWLSRWEEAVFQKRGVWTEKHPKKACQNHQGPREIPRRFAVKFLDPAALSSS